MSRALAFSDLPSQYDLDDYESDYSLNDFISPFWTALSPVGVNEDTTREREERILEWKNNACDLILEDNWQLNQVRRTNIKMYKGQHYLSQHPTTNMALNRDKVASAKNAKIVINHLHDLTEQHVARTERFKPHVKIVPANDEHEDKQAAKMQQLLWEDWSYNNGTDLLFQKFNRRKKIFGEDFIFVTWNAEKGDLHPSYVRLRELKRQAGLDPDEPIPLIDPNTGTPILSEGGEELFINRAVRIGDMEARLRFPGNVVHHYPESGEWDDVEWLFLFEMMDIEEVKARWPWAFIDVDFAVHDLTFDRFFKVNRSYMQRIPVRYFWHKRTPFLPYGYFSISVKEKILEEQLEYPYSHNELPCVRGTDIDIPTEIHGMSFFQNLVTIQHAINHSSSMWLQNQMLMTYPKWMTPRGAKVRHTDLGNDRTIVEYSGPTAPQLVAPNPTPPDVVRFREAMRDELRFIAAVQGASQGDPPKGITANVALRMLDEQEELRAAPAITKYEKEVVQFAKLYLGGASDYYDTADGRMIKIIGKDEKHVMEAFDVGNLQRSTLVRIHKINALPKSPAARTQLVLDIKERFPEAITDEEALEYMDIARPEKLTSLATVAREAAEFEIEELMQGKVPPAPSEYDDHLSKYRVYMKAVQSYQFKQADPLIQSAVHNHILTAEYLMWKKARLNPIFGQILPQMYPQFPMFFFMPRPNENPVSLNLPMPAAAPGAEMGPDAAPAGGIPPQAQAEGAPSPAQAGSVPQGDPVKQGTPVGRP
jgi:hypothetical protein